MSVKLEQSTIANASSLVLLQLFSRAFTFGLNQALVRLATPQTFGTAAVQFELLLSTILFLSREGVRNALLRSSVEGKKKHSNVALVENISLIPILLGVPISGLTALVYVQFASPSTASQPHFHLSVAVYAIAAILELLSEPLYIRAQNELRLNVRVRAEGVAVVSKSVVAFLVLALASGEWALVAFAAGQATYGLSLLVVFLGVYKGDINYVPKRVQTELHDNLTTSYFDTDLLNLSIAMTGQSVVKHFLTEGDKFLVSRLSPLEDQGGYAIASNYGSLVARIIFQPIEETSRLYFSKSLSSSSPKKPEKKGEDGVNSGSEQIASKVLSSLLLLFAHLLLLLVTFGPPYLSIATTLLLPPRFQNTSAPSILRSYVFYIPMMAFNGVLEAFFASTSTPSELKHQSRWMMVFSIVFVFAAYLLNQLGFGDSGLVYANVLNLFLRVVYCWSFARGYFGERGVGFRLSAAVPPRGVIGAFAWSYLVTRWSWKAYEHLPPKVLPQRNHIAVGIACVGICLVTCVLLERKLWRELAQVLRRR
ncbi:Rft-1-domain-containing protein [Thelephora terrestris]|uniref:Man(5)GlcNAc(2)-PP-dolichol translocation protein RFT1 n=1 Tax=Thelephora terrestris TaxID=56493 RepID=A0A9P6HBX4_9AGAM|nr:Rft-1-domain-containing protein [Thelephora terrestris]